MGDEWAIEWAIETVTRAILAILGTEMRRRLADRSIIVSSFVAPAVIAAIIGFAFGGSATASRGDIGIAFDQPQLSGRSSGSGRSRGRGARARGEVTRVSSPLGALATRSRPGALSRGVIIPDGFASSVLCSASLAHPTGSARGRYTSGRFPGLVGDVTIGPGNGPTARG